MWRRLLCSTGAEALASRSAVVVVVKVLLPKLKELLAEKKGSLSGSTVTHDAGTAPDDDGVIVNSAIFS